MRETRRAGPVVRFHCMVCLYTCTQQPPRRPAAATATPRGRSLSLCQSSHANTRTGPSTSTLIAGRQRPASRQLRSDPFTSINHPAARPIILSLARSIAMAAASSSSLRVPAPQRAVAVVVALLLVLVLLRAPCGGASRPVREGTTSNGAATVVGVRALDGDHHGARESVATAAAAARRATTVGGGAPTPPSAPSQNHN